MKPFEEKFADNVRQVFDNWQEPVDEQAWLQIKERLRKKKARPVIFLLAGWPLKAAAAVLVLFGTYTLWQLLWDEPATNLAQNETTSAQTSQSPTASEFPFDEIVADASVTASKTSQKTVQLQREKPGLKNQSSTLVHAERDSNPDYSTPVITEYEPTPEEVALVDGGIEPASDMSAAALSQSKPDENQPPIVLTFPFYPAGNGSRDNLAGNWPAEGESRQAVGRNPFLEFTAGSVTTYSPAEVAAGMGYAAGFTGNLPINERLTLSGGGILVYNQFTLNDPQGAVRTSSGRMLYASPEHDYSSVNNISYSFSGGNAQIEYTAIDIPMNLRYRFASAKNNHFYISAGLSSLIYVQQHFTNYARVATHQRNYDQYGKAYLSTVYSDATVETSVDAFKRIDPAKLVNFSVAWLVHRRKYNLALEPYIKYPLGEVTSMNIHIGMAGLSLRYNLQKK